MDSSNLITKSSRYEKYQKYSLEIHQRKLKQINSKTPHNFRNPVVYKIRKRKNVDSERELNQSNLKLLEKLIKIAKNKEKDSIRSITPMPKTLNSIIRKKEAFRISEENKKIAERISRRSPVLSSKFFEKEYELQSKYKIILSRYSFLRQKQSSSIRKLGPIGKPLKCFVKMSLEKETKENEIKSLSLDNNYNKIDS